MFKDKRSKKIVLIAHCILNQNAKIDGCAYYSGAMLEVTKTILDTGVGIIQMPCPELYCLGLDREADHQANHSIESEDTRVAKRMNEDKSRKICDVIAEEILYQVEEYIKNSFDVVGIIGINGSPTCGVETTWTNDQDVDGHGIFIATLDKTLENKSISLRKVGIRARDPKHAVTAIKTLLNS